MNLNYLETFITVANQKSFSRAAKVLNLTQPAVSKHIALLESFYGTRLVNRTSRRVNLTDAGNILYGYANEVINTLARAAEEIGSLADTVRGRLVVGASTIPGHYVLPAVMGEYRKRYPEVTISLEISNTGTVVNRLLGEVIHIGVIGAPVADERVACDPFAVDELVLIVPQNHPFAAMEYVTGSQLLDQKVVWREAESGTRRTVEQLLAAAGIPPERFVTTGEFGSTESVIAAVEAGLGISFVSRWAAEKAQHGGRLAIVPIKDTPLKRNLYAVYLKDHFLLPPVRAFLNLLKECSL